MKHLRHFLWDLDGVFFPADDTYHDAMVASLARYVATIDPAMHPTTATTLALQSHAAEKGYFKPFLDRYHVPFETLVQPVYAAIDIGFMRADPAVVALLQQPSIDHAILTTSSSVWTRRVLDQIGLSALFPDEKIIACADLGLSKSASPAVYDHALQKFGFAPENTAMIEDTQKNLRHAKAIGLTTILVNSEQPRENFTDHLFNKLAEFKTAFATANFARHRIHGDQQLH